MTNKKKSLLLVVIVVIAVGLLYLKYFESAHTGRPSERLGGLPCSDIKGKAPQVRVVDSEIISESFPENCDPLAMEKRGLSAEMGFEVHGYYDEYNSSGTYYRLIVSGTGIDDALNGSTLYVSVLQKGEVGGFKQYVFPTNLNFLNLLSVEQVGDVMQFTVSEEFISSQEEESLKEVTYGLRFDKKSKTLATKKTTD